MNEPDPFPNLPPEIQAYIRDLESRNAQLLARVRQLEEQFRLAQLKRYAPSSEKRSERLFNEAEQMEPELQLETVAVPDTGLPDVAPAVPNKRGRKALPADLPRKRVEHDISEEQRICACCQGALHRIGEEVSEQLHIPPASPWVWQHVRFKYGCRHCERHGISAPVVRASMPPQPLPGSVADAATIATVMTGKYADGMPLYRMETSFARAGVALGRGTMGDWMIGAVERHLQRLYQVMHATLLTQPLIHGDETTVQVLHEDGRSAQSQSYMWVYRSAESDATPVVLFEYQAGRGQQHPQAFLRGFTGTLMTDGYSAWRTLDGVRHLGCFAHARRYFDEAAKAQGKADGRARQALDLIGRLYQIEALAKGNLPDGSSRADYTFALRQQHSLPVLAALGSWLDRHAETVLPKSLLGAAITYARNQWPYLRRFVEDGYAPIDNNLIERDIRPFTTGRKNWLFSSTVAGANASAVIYSIMLTCRACGVEPYAYLRHVLTELPGRADGDDIHDLLPFNYSVLNSQQKLLMACEPMAVR